MTNWEGKGRDLLPIQQAFGDAYRTEVEASNVSGSPYRYLYVLLTDAGYEGDLIIISDGEEFGEDGYLVGFYADGDLGDSEVVTEETAASVIERVRAIMQDEGYAGVTG